MKISAILYSILISGVLGLSGCKSENKELKKDSNNIAEAMCKSMEAMRNLKMVDPADSVQVKKLQGEYKNIQTEMTVVYQEFKTKYGDKAKTKEFNEEFRKYLSESMLNCKSLTKEEREAFEKGTK